MMSYGHTNVLRKSMKQIIQHNHGPVIICNSKEGHYNISKICDTMTFNETRQLQVFNIY
jgi:hypothetical protein